MKVVILAGGLGTRLAEETETKPKPMVEIGDKPIVWHIMKHYASYGFDEFLLALGYKGEVIKRFFLDYSKLAENLTISLRDGTVEPHQKDHEDWTVHLIDTGRDTATGGRVGRLAPWLRDDTFMLTYGDGVSNVDLDELLRFHRAHGKLATICAVRPPSRFGELTFGDDGTVAFSEKPQTAEGWINGGFMVLEPDIMDGIKGDDTVFESDLLEGLAQEGQLMAYKHDQFWQCVDTLRDLRYLRGLWQSSHPPWKTWS